MNLMLLYVPIATEEQAINLSKLAVDARIAGCTNIFSIRSIFNWDNKLNDENEFVILFKTLPYTVEKLINLIEAHHPYKVPCIIQYEVEVNESYGQWIAGNLEQKN